MYRLLLILPFLCIVWVGVYTGPSVIQDSQSLALVGSEVPACNSPGDFKKICPDATGHTCGETHTYTACKATEGSADNHLCQPGKGDPSCGHSENCADRNADKLIRDCQQKS